MVDIIGAIIVFCLFMGVILIISGCHDYNEANRGMEVCCNFLRSRAEEGSPGS